MNIFNFKKNKKANVTNKTEKRSSNVVIKYVGGGKIYGSINDSELALHNSVVYRCMSILSDSVAQLPINIYHKNSEGYWEIDTKNNLNKLLTRKPNKRQTIYEFLEGIVFQMYALGNAYIYINRGVNINELVLIYPNCTFFDEVANKYTVSDTYNGIFGTFDGDSIIHLRHKSLSNLNGIPVSEYADVVLGVANAVDRESLKNISSGGRFRGILSTDSEVVGFGDEQDNQIQDIRDNMLDEINSGSEILSMPSGTKFQAISQTSKDQQLTDIKQYSLGDISRFFGVSLNKLGIQGISNYKASEDESINFFVDTLNPLLKKIEYALNTALISDSVSTKYKIEFNRTVLPYYSAILSNYDKMLQIGLKTVNDIRYDFNSKFIEDGNETIVSANLKTVKQLVKEGNTAVGNSTENATVTSTLLTD